jgi:co-chaperonin GroES (HSP10)
MPVPPKVLGHRVLVKPDTAADTTASGLILPQDRDHVPVSGDVVALGPDGSEDQFRARQEAFREALAVLTDAERDWNYPECLQVARENLARLIGTAPEFDIQIGDHVVFPAECGLAMTVDGDEYIVLKQDDCCVVVGV